MQPCRRLHPKAEDYFLSLAVLLFSPQGVLAVKVLMVGATLNSARHILRELKKREIKVRALVRNRDIERVALERGADETTIVDLRDGRGLISASVGSFIWGQRSPCASPT